MGWYYGEDCAMCAYLGDKYDYQNKTIECTARNIFVSPTSSASSCNHYGSGFKSSWEIDRIRNYFENHKYYIMTAICNILHICENSAYYISFVNFKDDYLMNNCNPEYEEFLEQYEEYGPIIATEIAKMDDFEYCKRLFDEYIKPFTEACIEGEYDMAFDIYNRMFTSLKKELVGTTVRTNKNTF